MRDWLLEEPAPMLYYQGEKHRASAGAEETAEFRCAHCGWVARVTIGGVGVGSSHAAYGVGRAAASRAAQGRAASEARSAAERNGRLMRCRKCQRRAAGAERGAAVRAALRMIWSVALFPLIVALLFIALASDKSATKGVSDNARIVVVFGASALAALGIGAAISLRTHRRWMAEAEQAERAVRVEPL